MEQDVFYIGALFVVTFYCYPYIAWSQASKKYAKGDYKSAEKLYGSISTWWWAGKHWKAQSLAARASARLSMEQYQLALDDIDQALEIQPVNSRALAMRGWCIWNITESAELAFIDLDKALSFSSKSAVALLYKGAVLFGSTDYEEAEKYLSSAVLLAPKTADNYTQRAAVRVSLLRHKEALADCDIAMQLAPRKKSLVAFRGWILNALGENDEAIQQCYLGLELSSNSAPAISALAAVLVANNRYEEALTMLNNQTEEKQNEYNFRLTRAVILSYLQRYEEALVDCDIATTLKISRRNHICKAYIYLCQGKLAQCNLELNSAERLHSEDFLVVSNRARWLVAMAKYQEALDLIKAFARKRKSAELSYDYLNTEGIAYKAVGEQSLAEEYFQRALKINPKSLEALWHHGDALERLGDVEKGSMEKKEAIESGYFERP